MISGQGEVHWNVLIIFSNDCMSIVSTYNVLYPVVAYIVLVSFFIDENVDIRNTG